jgi:hypothetical protein
MAELARRPLISSRRLADGLRKEILEFCIQNFPWQSNTDFAQDQGIAIDMAHRTKHGPAGERHGDDPAGR